MEVLCDRWYAAQPGLVYRAFTEPALLERWFCPSPDIAVRVIECEPKPGGRYRFLFHFPDSRVVPVVGEYRAAVPGKLLIFTWTWEPPDPWAGVVTLVRVDFEERKGGTQVHVHHRQLTTDEMRKPHQTGWVATLERLAPLMAELTE